MRLLQVASVFALLGLACVVWSLVVPAPIPVIVAMSAGEGLGTLSFVLYLAAIVLDLRRR